MVILFSLLYFILCGRSQTDIHITCVGRRWCPESHRNFNASLDQAFLFYLYMLAHAKTDSGCCRMCYLMSIYYGQTHLFPILTL